MPYFLRKLDFIESKFATLSGGASGLGKDYKKDSINSKHSQATVAHPYNVKDSIESKFLKNRVVGGCLVV